jgi:hypothetical protein
VKWLSNAPSLKQGKQDLQGKQDRKKAAAYYQPEQMHGD